MLDKIKVKAAAEPLLVRTAAVGLVTALIHVLVVLGVVPIDADQEQQIAGVVDFLGGVVAAWLSRRAVSPALPYEPQHAEAPAEPVEG